ncbi:ABC transporter substrate-binding protein [Vibrio sp. S9_S30]|uniref:substrate-binding periplasmic protein n=1 Tax=Vibrio sp. S9_S30 TaxID=2720226 RepID=UPI001680C18E|nr:ABC transporter substrate-binding protein [Vibrio sp. S9_S30]MBD1556783.1 ABC transporter substrate-binding protein [Vibrio sp. S9_S30]
MLTAASVLPCYSVADSVRLTSLYWPPYTGEHLAEQGASVAVAKAAFAAMGHQLIVEFYPWNRAVSLARSNDRYAGYFPAYYFRTNKLLFSDKMGSGMLGFVEQRSKPIKWRALTDLIPYKIGVVNGYRNTMEFDDMVQSGQLLAVSVLTDKQSVLKVADAQLDVAVIDENVLKFLKLYDDDVAKVKDKIQMNTKPLVNKHLYIAFNRGEQGEKWLEIFNRGLAKIDADKIMTTYMKQHFENE